MITCESCKAFFRRNANKEKEIRCPFNEQCEINMVSRRFCQRCRLTKCFAVSLAEKSHRLEELFVNIYVYINTEIFLGWHEERMDHVGGGPA